MPYQSDPIRSALQLGKWMLILGVLAVVLFGCGILASIPGTVPNQLGRVAINSLLLTPGIQPQSQPSPVPSPSPAPTAYPTYTSFPTPSPNATAEPYPTYTPYPTLSPAPTQVPATVTLLPVTFMSFNTPADAAAQEQPLVPTSVPPSGIPSEQSQFTYPFNWLVIILMLFCLGASAYALIFHRGTIRQDIQAGFGSLSNRTEQRLNTQAQQMGESRRQLEQRLSMAEWQVVQLSGQLQETRSQLAAMQAQIIANHRQSVWPVEVPQGFGQPLPHQPSPNGNGKHASPNGVARKH